ncbi:MAG: hypothetical protein K0S45_3920, partial [Nitrospira sp.]|nr:hypothetical protein [Nitrospira sp.]
MNPEPAASNPTVDRSTDSTDLSEADQGQALRKRAEALAIGIPENLELLSPVEARRGLHELRVHQIELEMQN